MSKDNDGNKRPLSKSPRICVIMPRFYPLYGGHIIQMRQFLPALIDLGIHAYVVTGEVDRYPKTAVPRGTYSVSARISRAARLVWQMWQTFIALIFPSTHQRQPDTVIQNIEVYRLFTFGPVRSVRARVFSMNVFWHLIANRRGYDVIHIIGTGWHCTLSILAAKLLNKRIVIEMILLGSDDPTAVAHQRMGKIVLAIWKRADRLISLSSALTQSALKMGFTHNQITQIPVGVDVNRFHPGNGCVKEELRARLGLPLDSKIIVFVGGIIARKGVDLLVEALPLLIQSQPKTHLVLVGPTDIDDQTRRFVEEQKRKLKAENIESHVSFAGRVDNVPEYLQAADLFTLPSETEGLPNSVLEAMACGLPVVISDMPGISEDIVQTNDEGVIVSSSRTPEAYAAEFQKLLADDTLRSEIGTAARKRIVNSFSIEHRLDMYEELYQSLVNHY